MTWCTVDGCANAREKGVDVRRFPRNPERREQWLKALKLHPDTDTRNRYVCEVKLAFFKK